MTQLSITPQMEGKFLEVQRRYEMNQAQLAHGGKLTEDFLWGLPGQNPEQAALAGSGYDWPRYVDQVIPDVVRRSGFLASALMSKPGVVRPIPFGATVYTYHNKGDTIAPRVDVSPDERIRKSTRKRTYYTYPHVVTHGEGQIDMVTEAQGMENGVDVLADDIVALTENVMLTLNHMLVRGEDPEGNRISHGASVLNGIINHPDRMQVTITPGAWNDSRDDSAVGAVSNEQTVLDEFKEIYQEFVDHNFATLPDLIFGYSRDMATFLRDDYKQFTDKTLLQRFMDYAAEGQTIRTMQVDQLPDGNCFLMAADSRFVKFGTSTPGIVVAPFQRVPYASEFCLFTKTTPFLTQIKDAENEGSDIIAIAHGSA